MNEPLFLKPIYKELLWGGNNIANMGYDAPEGKIGEAWTISAHPDGDCCVINGKYEGKTLSEMFSKYPELFGNCKFESFPLMSKIIDAKEDLSVQVHPDDSYANNNENGSLGKSECWYVLDCKKDATIILGQKCNSKDELSSKINANDWNDILLEQPIKPGDFMQINPGTVHAIKAGTIILENQQSSNVTYRLYDYNRLQDGKLRQLHIDKALDVINYSSGCPKIKNFNEVNYGLTHVESNEKYNVDIINVKHEYKMSNKSSFVCVNIVSGNGNINTDGNIFEISCLTNMIIPANVNEITFTGNNLKIILTYL